VKEPKGVGDRFQQETKYGRGRPGGGLMDRASRPPPYKEYPGARKIPLPPPGTTVHGSFLEIASRRRSVREYSSRPLLREEISLLLWASTGIQRVEAGHAFRTVPSAGALYPVEPYVIAHRVEGVEGGIYHYGIRDHLLEEVARGDFRGDLSRAALFQEFCSEAGAVFVWTAIFPRAKWKYGQRAYRYVYLDAGHVAQNLALAAVGLGLGSCQVAAFFDDEMNALLGVDGTDESVIYLSAVGHPR
jgi:SagB-type dehydrogenase family enzyme